MKRFNIEEAKAGKHVMTRDGRPVRIICFDRKHQGYPIMALVDNGNGFEQCMAFTLNGKYCENLGHVSPSDLHMETELKTGWVNVFKKQDDITRLGNNIYDTMELAQENVLNNRDLVDTIEIKWYE